MTMPKFEPVGWLGTATHPDDIDGEESVVYCFSQEMATTYRDESGYEIEPHFSEDQLTEAYEAGKRDAISKWQPIETAPKDGTAFRAYADELIDLDFNPWGSVEAAWSGEEFIGCVWNGQQDAWYGKAINPTHWMPLPAAPKGLK